MKLLALRRSKHTQAMSNTGLAHHAMFANVAGKIHPKASMLHARHALQFPFEQIALNGRQQMKSATLSKKSVDVILDAVIRRAAATEPIFTLPLRANVCNGSKADRQRASWLIQLRPDPPE